MLSYYSVFRWDPPSIGLAAIADPNKILESASVTLFFFDTLRTDDADNSCYTGQRIRNCHRNFPGVCFDLEICCLDLVRAPPLRPPLEGC